MKLKWMLINFAAPEFAVGQAWSNRRSVALLEGQFAKYQREDGVPWSRSHIYYANMGGFSIHFDELLNKPWLLPDAGPGYTTNLRNPEQTYSESSDPRPPPSTSQSNISPARRSHSLPDYTTAKQRIKPSLLTRSQTCNTSNPVYMAWDAGYPPHGFQPLPQYLRRNLDAFMSRGYASPREIHDSVQQISNAIGVINWTLDLHNIQAIKKAISIVCPDHFVEEWEREKFLSNHYDWFLNIRILCGNLWVLDANQLLLARELGIIETLPSLSQASLNDRNKGDLIVKILALVQISWMVIQLILRLAQNVPSSQLEIFTLSFAVCSVVTYILLIDKPKDVQTSYTIKAAKRPSAEDLILIANAGPMMFWGSRLSICIPNTALSRDSHRSDGLFTMYLGSSLAMIVFGAIHCLAWDFKFPTEAEKLCWHISAVITAGALPLLWALSHARVKVRKSIRISDNPRHPNLKILGFVVIVSWSISLVFVFSRLFITVEAFRSLAFLPPGAFLGTPLAGIPYVG
ncbi:uncharacterized protein N7529_000583 [Penicillium soppii]|uniref:uncharacterized protein n=1 Tax=Penicillium soppii TaxID=69789 RepID=UPI002549067A|nr:uncharacterized protein N7529_000583 [Penicillium soppii]KAJ5881911.1 hypothetical protein N7529_000583 [Penicillium soppii]